MPATAGRGAIDGESKDKKPDEEGWLTSGKARPKAEGLTTAVKIKNKSNQQARKTSPKRKQDAAEGGRRTQRSDKQGSAAQDDRSVVFDQLKNYVANDAPPEYVWQITKSLKDKGKEQRFSDYLVSLATSAYTEETKTVLMGEWSDEATEGMTAVYQGLQSYWNKSKPDHIMRLGSLLKEWIQKGKLTKEEVETRLRFMHFEDTESETNGATQARPIVSSYLGAVRGGDATKMQAGRTKEQQRMYDLCVRPYAELSRLRQRTEDENAALRMIISHEIEVPEPRRFLVQSLDALQLAKFTDYFMTLEFPMYAHLVSGQRFSADMTKGALLALISVGPEAAAQQRVEVTEFKASLSRITLNIETGLVTVTVSGKQAAQRWTDWKIPMGRRLLTVVDYEAKREVAKTTHELIRLDYYEFTIVVRKRSFTATDMHWLLTTLLRLEVQAMRHPQTKEQGVNDKQWTVKIKAAACPSFLRSYSAVKLARWR